MANPVIPASKEKGVEGGLESTLGDPTSRDSNLTASTDSTDWNGSEVRRSSSASITDSALADAIEARPSSFARRLSINEIPVEFGRDDSITSVSDNQAPSNISATLDDDLADWRDVDDNDQKNESSSSQVDNIPLSLEEQQIAANVLSRGILSKIESYSKKDIDVIVTGYNTEGILPELLKSLTQAIEYIPLFVQEDKDRAALLLQNTKYAITRIAEIFYYKCLPAEILKAAPKESANLQSLQKEYAVWDKPNMLEPLKTAYCKNKDLENKLQQKSESQDQVDRKSNLWVQRIKFTVADAFISRITDDLNAAYTKVPEARDSTLNRSYDSMGARLAAQPKVLKDEIALQFLIDAKQLCKSKLEEIEIEIQKITRSNQAVQQTPVAKGAGGKGSSLTPFQNTFNAVAGTAGPFCIAALKITNLLGRYAALKTGDIFAALPGTRSFLEIVVQGWNELERIVIEGENSQRLLASGETEAAALKKETAAIKARVENLQALKALKNDFPQNAAVRALDIISQEKNLTKIILAGQPQDDFSIPREKSWWAPVRLFQWFTRTDEQKTAFREGIKAARIQVFNKYGGYAVERFDNHFALRYRKGAPLTVGALNRFLDAEKKLQPFSKEASPEALSVFSFEFTETVTVEQFSEAISARAVDEFRERYYKYSPEGLLQRPTEMTQDDEDVLFIDFYKSYLQRPVSVKSSIAEIEIKGFFSARWNALWTSVFPGNNNTANAELENQLTEWIVNKMPETSQAAQNESLTIKVAIQNAFKADNRLTLEDVNELIEQGGIVGKEQNTWLNYLFYSWWQPVVGNTAAAVGVAAGTALVANDPSMTAGATKAAALAGAMYAAGKNRPAVQLTIALTALWAANNPKAVAAGENSIVSYITKAAKYGAIAVAGIHFPPLFLLAGAV